MDTTTLDELPKAVLHDHLDGSLRIPTLLELADEIGYRLLPGDDEASLAAWFTSRPMGSLVDFLEAYDHTIAVMQSPESVRRIAYECLEDHAARGVVYAEIRFGPSLHTAGSMRRSDVIEAVLDGMRAASQDHNIAFGVIIDALRHDTDSMEVAQAAVRFRGQGVVAFDLSGPEAGYPPDDHLDACRLAREFGLGLTIHAGEAAGLDSIQAAYGRCGAQRLGHGVRIVENLDVADDTIVGIGALAKTLIDQRITLEVCPSSNLYTGVAASIELHPLGLLHQAGFALALGTDGTLMSNTTMTREFSLAVEHHGFDINDLHEMTVWTLEAGFGEWNDRRRLISHLVNPAYRAAGSTYGT